MSGLTDAERGHVFEHFDEEDNHLGSCLLVSDVERIIAARLAEERERIARAIEAMLSGETGGTRWLPDIETGFIHAQQRAARIARGGAR